MRRPKRLTITAAVAAAAALVLTGCSGGGASDDATSATSKGGTLNILTTATAVHLDPATSQNLNITTLGLVLRRLTAWDVEPGKTAKVVPDLATNTGDSSDGGKTWTYHLKKGLKFQDGSAITTKDIKWGIERSFAPTLTGGLSYHKSLLVGGDTYKGPFDGKTLDSIETPDDSTIVFKLNAAYGDWPWLVSMPAFAPVPEGDGTDTGAYDAKPVASGPYQVQSNQQGSQITLVRNKSWSAKTDSVRTAGPSKVVFKESQDPSTVTQTLIADNGDAKDSFGATYLGAAELNQVRSNPSAQDRLATSKAGPIQYMAINTQKGSLKDLKVRQALQYAVDKKSYRIAAGGALAGTYASTLITPGIAGRQDYDLYETKATGDVAKAKSLLQQAGATDLKLTLLTPNDPSSLAESQALQSGLKRAGITVTLKPEDSDSFYTDATNGSDYDLALFGWQPDFPSANANIQPLYASSQVGDGGYNVSQYSNPDVDKLIDEATGTVDQDAAQKLWAQADKKIMEDAPVVPLIYAKQSFLAGSNVQDFQIADFPAYPNYLKVSLGK
ncbi:peptide/nickel transport system substrate-binding protein [Curtobacterium sp. PhB130]|uniref:ABC transporter substrate-binding protein n=1 Tax=unclassified Curtobacterium TaxID=257496 RepID=UPI000F4C6EBD|nr:MULTISPECIES: ABC transporter substrate-binding protein [unclassified Curtobacterium]ROP60961.1 peptide/nickel transport system substrate-binding protein [Curtobacterium sp. ZW137]ROS75965.1 peptide/nickel transport system substrate-binding protein [Curtobacterium sp. PhB130]TCK64339.1 peptide/nickel transport system substrate-binding protein [Curtobacterium sp. PhB136]